MQAASWQVSRHPTMCTIRFRSSVRRRRPPDGFGTSICRCMAVWRHTPFQWKAKRNDFLEIEVLKHVECWDEMIDSFTIGGGR